MRRHRPPPTPARLPWSVHLAGGVGLAVALWRGFDVWLAPWGLIAGSFVAALGAVGLIAKPRWRALAWLALGVGLATVRVGVDHAERSRPDRVEAWLAPWPQQLELGARGCLDRGPRRTRGGFQARLAVGELRARGDGWTRAGGRLRLWWPDGPGPAVTGDCVEVSGRAMASRPPLSPYGYDPLEADRRLGVAGVIVLERPPSEVRSPIAGPERLAGAVDRARLGLEEALLASGPSRGAAWVLAVGTGSRAGLPEVDRDAMTRAGIAHLLAVSGLHLALFVLTLRRLVSWLLRRATWLLARVDSRRASGVLVLPAVVAYVIFTGQGTAAVRAGLFVGCLVTAELIGRPRSLAAAIGVAAAIVLLDQPAELGGASFQLSFIAVAAIGVASGPTRSRGRRDSLLGRATGALLVALRVSVAVSLATAPVLAWHFGQVSLSGVVANVLVAPVLAVTLLPLAGAALLLAPLGGGWAEALCGAAEVVVDVAFAALDPLATALGDPWVVGRPTALEVAVATLLLLALTAAWRAPRAKRAAPWWVAMAVSLLVVLGTARSWPPPTLELWFLPVGQGDATLVRTSSGHHVLVDTGGALRRDPGREVIVPLLRGLGVQRLDVIVITHGDRDHVGGLASVSRAYPPRELWLGEPLARRTDVAALARSLSEQGTVTRRLGGPEALDVTLGTTRIELLHPPGHGWQRHQPGLDENDNSLVLRVSDGGRAALLTGDIEDQGEALLVARHGGSLRADVLKVPHHGSRTSSGWRLLAEVMPSYAVLPVGAGNPFDFPHPDVIARYQRLGIRTLRTDEGLVVIAMSPLGLRVEATRAAR